MHQHDVAATRHLRCPTCGQPTTRHGNSARPFCSVTCKLIDLGGWLDAVFRAPTESAADDDRLPAVRPEDGRRSAEEHD